MGSLNAAAARLGLGTASICALLLVAAVFQFLCLDAGRRDASRSARRPSRMDSSTASSRRRSSTAASCIWA